MGKITELCEQYRAGHIAFDELKQQLVAFDWKDLKWPGIFQRASSMDEGAMLLDEHGDMGFPEQDTLEELDAAWIDDLLTDEEDDDLYQAIWDAHQSGNTPVQEAD